MSALPHGPRRPLARPDLARAAGLAAACAAAFAGGALAALGRGPLAAAGIVGVGVALFAMRHWRWAILALMAFLPYSGLLIIAVYPNTAPATLAKDLLFVVPAYLGFGAAFMLRGRSVSIPGFPLGIALVFAAVVGLQLLNPSLPSLGVGLIGAKVWLLYIPLTYLAYHFVRTPNDIRRLLMVSVGAGVLPLLIGVVEGVLVNAGRSDAVYGLYGPAAATVTQQFADVGGESGSSILRVPSTFSFVAQYFLFTTVMVAFGFALWRGFLQRESARANALGLAFVLLAALASVLSGARGALVAVPVMVIAMLILEGRRSRASLILPLLAIVLFAIAASVFGTSSRGLAGELFDHAQFELKLNAQQGFGNALSRTVAGLGTGVDTVSARYALPEPAPFELVGGRLQESWWVKALLELGNRRAGRGRDVHGDPDPTDGANAFEVARPSPPLGVCRHAWPCAVCLRLQREGLADGLGPAQRDVLDRRGGASQAPGARWLPRSGARQERVRLR